MCSLNKLREAIASPLPCSKSLPFWISYVWDTSARPDWSKSHGSSISLWIWLFSTTKLLKLTQPYLLPIYFLVGGALTTELSRFSYEPITILFGFSSSKLLYEMPSGSFGFLYISFCLWTIWSDILIDIPVIILKSKIIMN